MADWKDILSAEGEQLSDEQLLKYLDDDLSEEERMLIEKKLNTSPFDTDALQGLSKVQNKESLQKHVNQLNHRLRQITGKKKRKEGRKPKISEWIILAIFILLFICVIGFIIVNLNSKSINHTDLIRAASELVLIA